MNKHRNDNLYIKTATEVKENGKNIWLVQLQDPEKTIRVKIENDDMNRYSNFINHSNMQQLVRNI